MGKKTAEPDYVEIFEGEDGDWYWHIKSGGNNKVIAGGGEGFTERNDANEAARRVRPDLFPAHEPDGPPPVTDEEG